MSTPSHPPDDDLPRDPAFDDAWRALSREEPSAALDAALRAAARREVGAGPQAAAATDADARTSKPMNWWRPLAVAATLGALAVGLMQLVTPERIGAPGRDGGVVSDVPATTAARQAEAQKTQAATASNEVAPAEERARAMSAPAASAGASADHKEAQAQSAAPPAQPAPVDDFKQQGTRKDVAPERKRDAGPAAASAPVPPATPAAKRIEEPAGAPAASTASVRAAEDAASFAASGAPTRAAELPSPPASKVAPPRVAEPFPAESAMRQSAPTKREAASDAVSERAPAAAGAIAPSAPEAPRGMTQAPKPAAENRAEPFAKLKTAPAQGTGDGGAAATDSAQLRREQDAQATQDKSAMQAAAPAGTFDARVAGHPALAVPDWIALIRRLIAEKNYTVADKELAAFRAAHPDAQRLLPPDLRDWKVPR